MTHSLLIKRNKRDTWLSFESQLKKTELVKYVQSDLWWHLIQSLLTKILQCQRVSWGLDLGNRKYKPHMKTMEVYEMSWLKQTCVFVNTLKALKKNTDLCFVSLVFCSLFPCYLSNRGTSNGSTPWTTETTSE